MEKSKPSVFISHAGPDKNEAFKLYKALQKVGINAHLDQEELHLGDNIVSWINNSVGESDYLLILVSEHSIGRYWVETEWSSALMKEADLRRTFVIPVVLPGIQDNQIPTLLRAKLFVDFRNDQESSLLQLVNRIKQDEQIACDRGKLPTPVQLIAQNAIIESHSESDGNLGIGKKKEINTSIIESIDERGILLIELGLNIYAYGLGRESIPDQLGLDGIALDVKDIYVRLGLTIPNAEIGPKMAESTHKTLANEMDRDCLAIGIYLMSAYSIGLGIIQHRGTEYEIMGEKKISEITENLRIKLLSIGILNKVEEENEISSIIFPKKNDSVDSYSRKFLYLKASIKGNFRNRA